MQFDHTALIQGQQQRANCNRNGDFLLSALDLSSQVSLHCCSEKQVYSLSCTCKDATLSTANNLLWFMDQEYFLLCV